MTETNEPKQEQPAAMHAYIEVMGHQCAVGRVSDVRIGNVTMLRVEPLADGARVQIINPTSIFRMTPCTEDEARAMAHRSTETITPWMLEAPRSPSLPPAEDDEHRDADFDDDPNHVSGGNIPF